MARIRSIKPEFWTSEQIMSCKPLTRLLFIGMWNFADDYGRMPYAPATIKAQILPGDTLEIQAIKDMLTELSGLGLILIYAAKGREYIEITGWAHQKIDKPHKPKHPGPVTDIPEQTETVAEPSPNIPRTLAVGEDRKREDKKERNRRAGALESPFLEFRAAYPKRKGSDPNEPAKKAFEKAVKSGIDPPSIIAAARKYSASSDLPDPKFIPMAASWLNKRYFEQYLVDQNEAARIAAAYQAMPHTPEFLAWKAYAKDAGRPFLTKQLEQSELEGRAYKFETRWPPGHMAAA